jgi:hypothetical protein
MVQVLLSLSREELDNMQYQILPENWERVTASMTSRLKFEKEFTEEEREIIKKYKQIFYHWYIKTGMPEEWTVRLSDLRVIQRAINFFATN